MWFSIWHPSTLIRAGLWFVSRWEIWKGKPDGRNNLEITILVTHNKSLCVFNSPAGSLGSLRAWSWSPLGTNIKKAKGTQQLLHLHEQRSQKDSQWTTVIWAQPRLPTISGQWPLLTTSSPRASNGTLPASWLPGLIQMWWWQTLSLRFVTPGRSSGYD